VVDRPLRILHVLRAPVGGLFRHVVDLAHAQAERGHLVGIIADGGPASPQSEATLKSLAAVCKLGVQRVPMSRHLGFRDKNAIRHVAARAIEAKAEILHGHGAKGGAYVRLARTDALRVYTPHGGSLHYAPRSPLGLIYLNLERLLSRRTDLFLFESEFGLSAYREKIGVPRALVRVVHNGVRPEELEPVTPDEDAADVVFVGELRTLKGVDLLIDAIARNAAKSAILFGDGPDAEAFRADVAKRGLASRIEFGGMKPAREAFRRGRVLVVPSRAESFPYIVLEAAAAAVPLVATRVGGIPEIFGPDADELVAPDAPGTLAEVIASALKNPPKARTARLQQRVASLFTVSAMTDGALKAYGEAMDTRQRPNP
jgi:glycosyltransferase involved in cell wall biosynthesis